MTGSATDLYPEIDRRRGLAAALAADARERGLDLGAVHVPAGYEGVGSWKFARIEHGPQRVTVCLRTDVRQFLVGVTRRRRIRAEGGTDSLATVVDIAAAWCAGLTLRDLGDRFPFMVFTGLELAFEENTHVERRWRRYLGNDAEYPRLQPLLRAAHDDDRLRRLFPSITDDEVLRFEMDAFDESPSEITVHHLGLDEFRVSANWPAPATIGGLAVAVAAASALAVSFGHER